MRRPPPIRLNRGPNFAICLGVLLLERWLPVVAVLAIYAVRMAELGARRDTIPGPVRERWTLRLFMLAGTLMIVGGSGEYFFRAGNFEWFGFVVGGACGVASFAIRRSAIRALGRFWSLHVEIRETHQIVREGPFRWVRHPVYFSMILELLSAGFILHAWATLGVVSVIFVPALCWRVRIEELALVEKFGAIYQAYQATTPAVLPYKFPKAS